MPLMDVKAFSANLGKAAYQQRHQGSSAMLGLSCVSRN